MGELKRKENETELGYKARLYREKLELGLNNKQINEIINKELNINLAESSNRCSATAYNQGWFEAIEKYANETSNDEYLKELEDKKREIEKERVKLRTEKIEYNKLLREDSRLEMLFDNFKESIKKIEIPDFNNTIITNNEREAILGISDFHFGKVFVSINNEYSEEIFYERMEKLLSETINLCKENNISNLHVLNCGDDIEGMTLRISQLRSLQYGFTDQVTRLMKYMVKFLNKLSEEVNVVYHHVLSGNHSEVRAFGDKSFTLENMERIIITYIRDMTENNPRVQVPVYNGKFVNFNILGYNIYAQHGQKVKNPKQIIGQVTQQLRKFIDVAYFGHLHHEQSFTTNEAPTHDCEVVYIPSTMGSDEYSDDNFFGGAKASAKFDIYEKGKCRKGSFKILLN
ncbi:hypothetical protein [Clostridium butyricum]|uniref:hypothetical protein n=1 Tax=Clostridium butyricum TaxID=1492 RepID=UPI00325BA611